MKRFTGSEIRTFLKALDEQAPEGSRLVIIGGAAARLSFGVPGGTLDIDTANAVTGLEEAARKAREKTRLGIPLGFASIFDGPYEYESRLQPCSIPGLRNLELFVPDKHDWALMKGVRFEDKDLEHLQAASKSVGFDPGVFEERFLAEMTHVLPRERLVRHFLAMIEELFGEKEAARLEAAIKAHRHWK